LSIPNTKKARVTTNLQLLKGKTTTGAGATIVLDGGASNNRAKEIDGTGGNVNRLGDASLAAAKLAAGLIEVCPHATLPLLAEVVAGDLLYSEKKKSSVSLHHHHNFPSSDTAVLALFLPIPATIPLLPPSPPRHYYSPGQSTWLCLMAIASSLAVP
jgi:hypothetical protein